MTITADILERYMQIAAAVFVIIALAAVLALVFRRKKIAGKSSRTRNILYGLLSLVLLAALIGSNIATSIYASSIRSAMTKAAEPDPTVTTTMDDWKGLVTDIADEGMVLMKNENMTLPLEKGTKINLLGYCAYNPFYSGSGSGSVSDEDSVTVVSALTDAGFEINPDLEAADIWPAKPEDTNPFGYDEGDLFFGDVSTDTYSGAISFEAQKTYSDTAIVVIGRAGGEGYDLTSLPDADYLALNQEEKDLLAAAQENFETLIVVLNMANAVQMGELLQYDIDAMVWTGVPGPYGFESLGRILNGTVNPSGSLPDTWVMDNDSIPALENFGDQKASNAVMTSMNYIGDTYAGAHAGLLETVLRGEWGFRGKSLTDMDEGGEAASADKCMRAGTDAWLSIHQIQMKEELTDTALKASGLRQKSTVVLLQWTWKTDGSFFRSCCLEEMDSLSGPGISNNEQKQHRTGNRR